jgi:chromosome partitioning protein
MITIAVANQKGGVGKTTIAFNLAYYLSKRRKTKVLAVDNDPQGNLTLSFADTSIEFNANILNAYDGKPLRPFRIYKGLSLLGSDISLAPVAERDFKVIFKLKESLQRLNSIKKTGRLDYVIIDCLPSFGHLHLAALNAANYVLVPVKPAPYALAGLKDLFFTIEKAKKYFNPKLKILGIIMNQVDGRRPVLEREMEGALREAYDGVVLKSKISKRIKLEESPALQKSIITYDPRGPSAKEFKIMTNEIIRRIKMARPGG